MMNKTSGGRHKYWEVVGPVTSRCGSEAEKVFSDGRDSHVFGGGSHGPITESNAKRIFGIETCHSIRAFKKPRVRVLTVNLPTLTEKKRYSFLRRVLEKKPDVYAFFGDVINLKDIVIRTRSDNFDTIRNIAVQSASEEGVSEEKIIIKTGDAPKLTTTSNYFETGSFYPQKEKDNIIRALKDIPVCGLCETVDDGRVLFRLADGAMKRYGRHVVDLLIKRGILTHKCELVTMNNSQVKTYLSKPGRVIKGVNANRLMLRRPNIRKDFSKMSKNVLSKWCVVDPEYTRGRRFDYMIRSGLVCVDDEVLLSDVYTVDLPLYGKGVAEVKRYLGITNARSITPLKTLKRSTKRKMFMMCFDDVPMGEKVNNITSILRLDPRITVNFIDPIGVYGVTFTLPRSAADKTEALIEKMKTSLETCATNGHEKPELVMCNDVVEKETLNSRNHNRKCSVIVFYLKNIELSRMAVPSYAYCFAATSSKRVFFRVPEGISFNRTRFDLLSRCVVGFEGLVYNISVEECNAIVKREEVLIQKNLDLLLTKRRPKGVKLKRCA